MAETPQIVLPEIAHHNNLGELPIVEMADDGVFSEIDGEEWNDKRKMMENACFGTVSTVCFNDGYQANFETEEECLAIAKEVCGGGEPSCDALDAYGLGIYTCWGTFR